MRRSGSEWLDQVSSTMRARSLITFHHGILLPLLVVSHVLASQQHEVETTLPGPTAAAAVKEPEVLNPEERAALVSFYNNMNGPYWLRNRRWLDGDPCIPGEEWEGVGCVGPIPTVINIDLPTNNVKVRHTHCQEAIGSAIHPSMSHSSSLVPNYTIDSFHGLLISRYLLYWPNYTPILVQSFIIIFHFTITSRDVDR